MAFGHCANMPKENNIAVANHKNRYTEKKQQLTATTATASANQLPPIQQKPPTTRTTAGTRKSQPACRQHKGILEHHAGTNKYRVIMHNFSQHQWTAMQGLVASPFAVYQLHGSALPAHWPIPNPSTMTTWDSNCSLPISSCQATAPATC